MKIRNVVTGLLLFLPLTVYGLSEEDKRFIEKYQVSQEVADILDRYYDDYYDDFKKCWRRKKPRFAKVFTDLPEYYVKYGLNRIAGMEIAKECIKNNTLTCLTVPNKYIYHVPGRPLELKSENYLVVAERKHGKRPKLFSFEEVVQICLFLRETGCCDFIGRNTLRLKNQQIVYFDTELKDFDKARPYHGLGRLLWDSRYNFGLKAFSMESVEYIFAQLLTCLPEDKEEYKKLYKNIYNTFTEKQHEVNYVSRFVELFPNPEQER